VLQRIALLPATAKVQRLAMISQKGHTSFTVLGYAKGIF
jgi:hypothetical protein